MQRSSPAAARNLAPIIDTLREQLPREGTVVELASGPGQHVAAFAKAFPELMWQPSDVDAAAIESTRAWRSASAAPNLLEPIRLDLADCAWEAHLERPVVAMVAVNVCHIAPYAVTLGLLRGAAARLVEGGRLFIYGPFKRQGEHTAPSNAAFDASLRASDPSHGVRDLDEIATRAAALGLSHSATHAMPSNNLIAQFERTALCS